MSTIHRFLSGWGGTSILAFGIMTCGCGKDPVRPAPDLSAPGVVSDLVAFGAADSAITLRWHAPGDDGTGGTAAQYDIRFTTNPLGLLSAGGLEAAGRVATPPVPTAGGSIQEGIVRGLQPRTTYYFALRTRDDAGNTSALSNIASGSTWAHPPAELARWGGAGSGPGKFGTWSPSAVAIDRARRIAYAADP